MKDFLKLWIPITVLVIGAFWFTAQFIKPAPAKILTIAAGRPSGVYAEFAKKYKRLLEDEGFKVNILESAGSIENIQLLEEGKADIGFVQGGTPDEKARRELESLASIYYEPLWLFYSADLGAIHYVSQLQGKRVAIGEVGSGTRALVQKIADANRLQAGDTKIFDYGLKDAYNALKDDRIDAFFSVISADSPVVRTLMRDEKVQLVSLKRVNAYERIFPFATSVTIYEGTLDLVANIPKTDIRLLATTATLAMRKGLDDSIVRIFMKQVAKVHKHRFDIFKSQEKFPSQKYLEIPINDAAKHYLEHGDSFLEKIFPFWIAFQIDRLKILLIPLLTLLLPLFKGFMPLYRWRIRSKIYKWYKQLDVIDREWDHFSKSQLSHAIGDLKKLQSEIKEHINVPLAYMSEYYLLRTHVDFVLEKLEEEQKKMA